MKHQFTVLIERDEDNYLVATVPSLKSCYTQARTMKELMPRVREVIQLCMGRAELVKMTFKRIQKT